MSREQRSLFVRHNERGSISLAPQGKSSGTLVVTVQNIGGLIDAVYEIDVGPGTLVHVNLNSDPVPQVCEIAGYGDDATEFFNGGQVSDNG